MGISTHPSCGPGGPERHSDDYAHVRHGRDRLSGFPVGRYLQPPPMLFTRDGHNLFLGDMYRGSSAFLICAGPSLAEHDLTQLGRRGILTMAVNNAAAVFRPNLWVSVDDPGNFCDAIWRDPAITKFVPLCHMEKPICVRDDAGNLIAGDDLVGDMPAVFGYRRNEAFHAEQWLVEDSFNWGNHGKRVDAYGEKGSRSVMYVALRMLYYLGVRKVYLLGCDFRMDYEMRNYAFEQDRSPRSVRNNNHTYRILNIRLAHLLPHFRQAGFQVLNCTPDSGLTVFDHIEFDQAVREAAAVIPERMNTAGMYDRQKRERDAKRASMLPPRIGERDELGCFVSLIDLSHQGQSRGHPFEQKKGLEGQNNLVKSFCLFSQRRRQARGKLWVLEQFRVATSDRNVTRQSLPRLCSVDLPSVTLRASNPRRANAIRLTFCALGQFHASARLRQAFFPNILQKSDVACAQSS